MNEALMLTRKLVRIESTNPGKGEQNVVHFLFLKKPHSDLNRVK